MKYLKILSPLLFLFPGILIALLYSFEIDFPIYGSDEFLFFTFTMAFSLLFLFFYLAVIAYPGIVFSIVFTKLTIQIAQTSASARQRGHRLKQKFFRLNRNSQVGRAPLSDPSGVGGTRKNNSSHQHLKKTALKFFLRSIANSKLDSLALCAPAFAIELLLLLILFVLKKLVFIVIVSFLVFFCVRSILYLKLP